MSAFAQQPPPPEPWVLVDDIWLPQSVVSGDATFQATPWPGGIVPYAFNPNVDSTRQAIALDAMAEIAAVSNVTFIPRTTEPNHVVFTDSTGNNSYVGMIGGGQIINIFNWNYRFIVCHEILHALGFWHEHQRPDRDTYVTIQSANIVAGYANNFTIMSGASTQGTSYDFDSVMHYDGFAFSSNNLPTIQANPGYTQFQNSMGQRQHLSLGDCAGCAFQYGSAPAPTITSVSPSNVTAGSTDITLSITGTRYNRGRNDLSANAAQGTKVYWLRPSIGWTQLASTYINPTSLTATVPAAFLASAGTTTIRVENPSPGGGISNLMSITIGALPANVSSVTPNSRVAGSTEFTAVISGANFMTGAGVLWDGSAAGITVVSQTATQITALIPAVLVSGAGIHTISVANPGAPVGTSATFTVLNPLPSLVNVSPSTLQVATQQTATLSGSGFNSQSEVLYRGSTNGVTILGVSPGGTAQTIATAWGLNGSGQTSPPTLPAGKTFVQIAAGANHSLGRLNDGTIVAWGYNGNGQCTVPPLPTGTTYTDIAAGHFHSLARRSDGALLAWGWNAYGQCNVPTTPVGVTFVEAAAGDYHTVARRSDGVVVAFGRNDFGQCNVPTLPIGQTWVDIACGGYHTVARRSNGTMAAWGYNGNGQCTVPTIPSGVTVSEISAGLGHTVARLSNNTLIAFGDNSYGQCNIPPLAAGLTWTEIATGYFHTLARRSDGDVKAFGDNGDGQCNVPNIYTGATYTKIAAGGYHSVALRSDSTSTITVSLDPSVNISSAAGSFSVQNPAPGGGSSASLSVSLLYPTPEISSVSPLEVSTLSSGETISVSGAKFGYSSVVKLDGTSLSTTFIGTNQLSAYIPGSLLQNAGGRSITVFNPAPAGGTSYPTTLTVSNPAPGLASVTPTAAFVNQSASFTLSGFNFAPQSQVRLDGSATGVTVTSRSTNSITVTVAASRFANTGVLNFEVYSPAPGGGYSAPIPISVNNPTPTLVSVSPNAFTTSTIPSSLSISGTNFTNASIVSWNGTALATTVVSSTSLTATIPTGLVTTAGTFNVSVYNPPPGGGTSAGALVTVTTTIPTLTAATPSTLLAGSTRSVTLSGSGFLPSTIVTWNGSTTGVTVTSVTSTTLTLNLSASVLLNAGTGTFVATNPGAGGGSSAPVSVAVVHPSPTITAVIPATFDIVSPPASFTITGTGFSGGSVVYWDSTPLTTNYLWFFNILTAALPASAIGGSGSHTVTVVNPAPGGGISSAFIVNITSPTPVLSSVSPNVLTQGSGATLLLSGSGFNAASTVEFNGSSNGVTVTAVTPTSITATIAASVTAQSGTATIAVRNPPPGGGVSATLPISITPASPTIASVSPGSFTLNSIPGSLTVNGSNFAVGSVVSWNGTTLATTYGSPTTLTAVLPVALVSTAGNYGVTVANPGPSGGTSNVFTVPVSSAIPVLNSVMPTTVFAGSSPVLTLTGQEFHSASFVTWNGSTTGVTISIVTPTTLVVTLSPGVVLNAGSGSIAVTNPGFGGGSSSPLSVSVVNPTPSITSVAPASVILGTPSTILSITGTGFSGDSVVYWDSTPLTTIYLWMLNSVTATLPSAAMGGAGAHNVTVVNPGPGGGNSNTFTVTVANPVPVLASLSINSITLGEPASVTLGGSNFTPQSTVEFNGSSAGVTVTSVTTTSMTVSLAASVAVQAGPATLAVRNPAPGGGVSTTLPITVNNPVPILGSVFPFVAIVGQAQTFNLVGTGFNAQTVVLWNGSSTGLTSSLGSLLSMSVNVPASLLAAAGPATIEVFNPAPGGGTSNSINVEVRNPLPTVASVSPTTITTAAAATINVSGSGFVDGTFAKWNGGTTGVTVGAVTPTSLTVTIADTLLTSSGIGGLEIVNSPPGGGSSGPISIAIEHAVPTLANASPSTFALDAPPSTLSITGSGFDTSSVVTWDGTVLPRTLVGPTSMTASIPAGLVTLPGTYPVTVNNPAPGGGKSSAFTVTVTNPVPYLGSISPSTVLTATLSQVTLTGTGFNGTSEVRVNGATNPGVTIVAASATDLVVDLDEIVTQNAGPLSLTVFNPAPGGGTSTATILNVVHAVPTLNGFSPDTVTTNDGRVTLIVDGDGFDNASVVTLNGAPLARTLLSASRLEATIPSASIMTAGSYAIAVVNPPPGGGTTTSIPLSVLNPVPTVTNATPSTLVVGSTGNLVIGGSGFNAASTVALNGSSAAVTVTAYTSTTLNVAIDAVALGSAGAATLTVSNPAPGGGTSNTISIAVENPIPTLVSVAPATLNALQTQTVVLTGSGFNTTSSVRWNGSSTGITQVASTSTTLTIIVDATSVPNSGSGSFTVFNPSPGGGTSAPVNVTINRPIPVLASLSPSAFSITATPATLTINGTGFEVASIVRWNGTDLATTFGSPTQVSATIPASLVTAAGVVPITVFNPAPGGGTSNALSLTVENPVPTLASVTPTSVAAGANRTFTLTGTNFSASTSARWNGSSTGVTVGAVTSTSMTVTVSGAQILNAGTYTIAAFNPAPGGGTSTALNISVVHPAPTVNAVSPSNFSLSSPPAQLTVSGTGFDNASVIYWDSTPLTTTYTWFLGVLTAPLPAAVIGGGGNHQVRVVNPAPGGGTSTSLVVSVTNPAPTLSSVLPSTLLAGSNQDITLSGTNFGSSSTVALNGSTTGITVTAWTPTSLTATIAATRIPTAASGQITVINPPPGGGTSTAIAVTINHPAPVLSTVSPTTFTTATAPSALAITGTGFDAASVVRWDGTPLTTTFVSGTSLSAALPTNLANVVGSHFISVVNPTPGGGTSSTLAVSVTNPLPVLTGLSPSTIFAAVAQNVTLIGSGFNAQSQVLWNGSSTGITITSLTASAITVNVAGSLIPNAGTASLRVVNPTPGGGSSSLATVNIQHPVPGITSISPQTFSIATPPSTLTVTGSGFDAASVVRWDGIPLTTTFVSGSLITASLPGPTIGLPGSHTVYVFNPSPVGGLSNAYTMTVEASNPSITALNPPTAIAGAGSTVVAISGSNFHTNLQAYFDGAEIPTTYNSPTSVSVVITNANLQVPGPHTIVIDNIYAGTVGASNAAAFTVLSPEFLSMAPTTVSVGTQPVTLDVVCLNVGPQSVVYADGIPVSTTLLGPSSLRAVIPSGFGGLNREGGIAINVQNTLLGVTSSAALRVGTSSNGGVVTHYPILEPVPPNTPFSFVIEGGVPGAPLTLFLDITNPAPVTGFPDPTANMVVALSPAGSTPLFDGIGMFGPPLAGFVFAPNPPPVPLSFWARGPGSFTLPEINSGAAPIGINVTMQAFYVDPATPGGIKLTWPRFPIGF